MGGLYYRGLSSYCRFEWIVGWPIYIRSMSEEEPQPVQEPAQQPEAPQEEEMSKEDEETYNKMMNTLSKMSHKIEKARTKLNEGAMSDHKAKTDQMTDKLIQSKESSEIVTKENLLTDITESYEKVVIEVYSENSKLKKKLEEMAKLIKEQNSKIYEHTRRERELVKQNEDLRSEIVQLKDERMVKARGHAPTLNATEKTKELDQNTTSKKKTIGNAGGQNEDFDFWSMPQNEHGKKKKDFVENSNLWVNQKPVNDSVFLTEEQPSAVKRKK